MSLHTSNEEDINSFEVHFLVRSFEKSLCRKYCPAQNIVFFCFQAYDFLIPLDGSLIDLHNSLLLAPNKSLRFLLHLDQQLMMVSFLLSKLVSFV